MNAFDVLHRIVSVPSPTGREQAVVDALLDQARSDGVRASRDGVGNFVAEFGRGKRLLLFVGHVDTVEGSIPVRIAGGTLHGRGSVDAKAPLVAFYAAARAFLDDADVRIRLVGAVDEEGDSRGAKGMDRSRTPDWIVVGEPSGSDGITLGYKGILRGSLHLRRPHHHGAHAAPSAADELVQAWSSIRHTFDFQERFEQIQGRLLEFTSRNDGLTDHAVARFALRLPPGITTAKTAKRLRDVAIRLGAEVEFGEMMEAAVVDKHGPLVAAYMAAIRAEGQRPRLKQKTGTADFNHLHQWYPRVPIVAYGPGDASLDHTPNERIERTEFERGVRVNERVIRRLADTSPERIQARKP